MKNYFVVGGSAGIGRSLVSELDREGHTVFATYYQHPVDSSERMHYHSLDVNADSLSLDFLPDNLHGFVYAPVV